MHPALSRLAIAGALFLPSSFGGWASITVHDVPDRLTVDKPTEVTFTVRQHGATLLDGLSPRIEARLGREMIDVAARPAGKPGVYRGWLTVPTAGDWTVTIRSSFGKSDLELLPLQALAASSGPSGSPAEWSPPAAPVRGRALFVAKGCATCHTHAGAGRPAMVAAGPDLSEPRLAAEYLARYLADPSIKPRPAGATGLRMPNLGLSSEEISAIIAFLNASALGAAR